MTHTIRQQIRESLVGRNQDLQISGPVADKLSTSIVGPSRGTAAHLRETLMLLHIELNDQSKLVYTDILTAVDRGEIAKREAVALASAELAEFWKQLAELAHSRVTSVANRYVPPKALEAGPLLDEFQRAADRLLARRRKDALRGHVEDRRIVQPALGWLGSPVVANVVSLLSMLVALTALMISLLASRQP